jgi:hypothetical protein
MRTGNLDCTPVGIGTTFKTEINEVEVGANYHFGEL